MDVRQRGAGGSGMATTDLRKIPRTKSSNGNKSKTASHVMVWKIVTWGVCLVLVALCLVLAVAGKNPLLATTKGGSSATNTRGVKEQAQKDAVDRKIYEQLQEENKVLKQRVNNLQNQQQQQQANSKTTNDGAAAAAPDAKKIKRLIDYKKRMHEMIQFISKRNLVQKYGHGPHFVEILVSYDPGSNVADAAKAGQDTETLLIELAPTDEMPATVFWFLEQVNATLFDGCSFHRNAHHVVQGGPAVNFETVKGQGPQRRFTESKLESVPFQE